MNSRNNRPLSVPETHWAEMLLEPNAEDTRRMTHIREQTQMPADRLRTVTLFRWADLLTRAKTFCRKVLHASTIDITQFRRNLA